MGKGRKHNPLWLPPIITLPDIGKQCHETYINYMETLKTLDLSEFCPPKWLQHCETPFKWMQNLDQTKMFKIDVDRKINDYPEEDYGIYRFEKFCLHLVSVFHNTILKNNDGMKESLQKLENILQNISYNQSYSRMSEAFHHVFKAIKAQVSFRNNSLDEEMSRSIGESLAPSDELKPVTKAGIEAIKAHFYVSNYNDPSLALEFIKKASKLDGEETAWMYWTGKIHRLVRKKQDDLNPSEEELQLFESAVQLKRDPKHVLYLAQAYCEKATYLKYESKRKHKNTDMMNTYFKKAQDLFRECKSMRMHSYAINVRLAKGAMNLYQFSDYDLAEEMLLLALNNSTNPSIYLKLGLFYTDYKQNFEKAIEYFKKGAEQGMMCCFDELMRYKYILYPKYDPYKDLKMCETIFQHSSYKHFIYSDFVWYYVFIKPNISKALKYCIKLAEHDLEKLFIFHSYCFNIKTPINIYLIMKDFNNKHKEQRKKSFKKMYEHFLSIIPENMIENPNTNKENNLHQIKKEVAKKVNLLRSSMKKYFIQHGKEKKFLLNQTSCAENQNQNFNHSSKYMINIWVEEHKNGSFKPIVSIDPPSWRNPDGYLGLYYY